MRLNNIYHRTDKPIKIRPLYQHNMFIKLRHYKINFYLMGNYIVISKEYHTHLYVNNIIIIFNRLTTNTRQWQIGPTRPYSNQYNNNNNNIRPLYRRASLRII